MWSDGEQRKHIDAESLKCPVARRLSVLIRRSLVACSGDSVPEIPGLDPNDDVELVEMEADPSESFVWSHALRVEDLPRERSPPDRAIPRKRGSSWGGGLIDQTEERRGSVPSTHVDRPGQAAEGHSVPSRNRSTSIKPSPSLTVATLSRAFGFDIHAARLRSRVSVPRWSRVRMRIRALPVWASRRRATSIALGGTCGAYVVTAGTGCRSFPGRWWSRVHVQVGPWSRPVGPSPSPHRGHESRQRATGQVGSPNRPGERLRQRQCD